MKIKLSLDKKKKSPKQLTKGNFKSGYYQELLRVKSMYPVNKFHYMTWSAEYMKMLKDIISIKKTNETRGKKNQSKRVTILENLFLQIFAFLEPNRTHFLKGWIDHALLYTGYKLLQGCEHLELYTKHYKLPALKPFGINIS